MISSPHQPAMLSRLAGTLRSTSSMMTITVATGDEHDELFAEQAKRYPQFAAEAKTDRTIPVIILERA